MINKIADVSSNINDYSRNNPYRKASIASGYENLLKAPFARKIRRDEEELLMRLFRDNLCKEDTVLEIGAGTGYYTISIASLVRKLTAVEPASGMAHQLREKAAVHNVTNIDLHEEYFEQFTPHARFDYVIAIGVLDFIDNPHIFIERCLELSRKKFIFTVPEKGFWTLIYKTGAFFQKTKIYRYSKKELRQLFPDSNLQIIDVGLKSMFTRGFTLVCVATGKGSIWP
jgi:protein-L-isoaspartate O-methyltransferase